MELKDVHQEMLNALNLTNEDEILFDPLLTSFIQSFYVKHEIQDSPAFELKLDEFFEIRKKVEFSTAQQIKVLKSENETLKIKLDAIKNEILEKQLLTQEYETSLDVQNSIISNIPMKINALDFEIKEIEGVLGQLIEMNSEHVSELINKKQAALNDIKEKNSANKKILDEATKTKEKYTSELSNIKIELENKNSESLQYQTNIIENEKRIELIQSGSTSLEDVEFNKLKDLYLFFLGKTVKEVNGKLVKENNFLEQKNWIKTQLRKENTNYIPSNWKVKLLNLFNQVIPYPVGIIVKEENSTKNEKGILGYGLEKISSTEIQQSNTLKPNPTLEFFYNFQAQFILKLKTKLNDSEFIITPKYKFCFTLESGIMVIVSFRKRNNLLLNILPEQHWFLISSLNKPNTFSTTYEVNSTMIPYGFYWLTETDIIEINFQA